MDVDFYFNILNNYNFEYIYEPLMSIGHDGDQLTDYYKAHPRERIVEARRQYRKYKYIHSQENRFYINNMEKQYIKKRLRGILRKNQEES